MTDKRDIKTDVYNERVEGSHVGRDYYDFGFKCKKQHARFVRWMLVGFGIGLIVYGLRILFTDGFIFPQAKISLILGWLLLMLICSYYAFFWKRDENYNNETNISQVRDRRRFAAVGMVGISLSTIVVVCLWMHDPTNTIVTFANFHVTERDINQSKKDDFSISIRKILEKDTEVQGEKDIEIKPINKAFATDAEEKKARAEAKDRRATISIWGHYVTPQSNIEDQVKVSSFFEILKRPPVVFLPHKDEYKQVFNQDGLKLSELNINVTNEPLTSQRLAYLTNFVAGLAHYKSGLAHCDPKKIVMSKEAKESFEKSEKRLKLAESELLKYIQEDKSGLSKQDLLNKQTRDFLTSITNFYLGNTHSYKAYCSNQFKNLYSAIDSFSKAIESISKPAVTSDNKQNSYVVEHPYSLIPASYHTEGEYDSYVNNSYNNQEITCGTKRDKNVMVSNRDSDFNILLSRIYHNRGIAYEMEGNIVNAFNDYIQAIILDPETDEFCLSLGSAYANRSNNMRRLAIANYNNAEDYYRQLAIDNYNNAENSLAYYNLGNIYLSEGNYVQAIINYLLAIISDFNFSEAYNNLKIAVFEGVGHAFKSVGHAFEGVGDAFKDVDVGKIFESFIRALGTGLESSHPHFRPVVP